MYNRTKPLSRLAQIYKSEKTKGGGVGSTIGKRVLEKLDPRQMFDQYGMLPMLLPGLFKSYKATSTTKTEVEKYKTIRSIQGQLNVIRIDTKLTAKNTMVLPAMARDMNVIRQNVVKIVKLMGGKPQERAYDYFNNAARREKQYESQYALEGGKKVAGGGNLDDSNSPTKTGGLMGSLLKGIGLGATGIGAGVGLAAVGTGIAGFFTALAAGSWAIEKLGGGEGIKKLLTNLGEGLNAFNVTSLVALGGMLGAGALFGPVGWAKAGSTVLGLGAIGLGIGGFLSGLSIGAAGVDLLGDNSEKVSKTLVAIATGLNAFSIPSLVAFGGMIGTGALFGPVASLGIGAIGAGLGLFLTGFGLGVAAFNELGGPEIIEKSLKALANGLKEFAGIDANSLLVIGEALPKLTGEFGLGSLLKSFFFGEDIQLENIANMKESLKLLAEGLSAFSILDAEQFAKVGSGVHDLGEGLVHLFSSFKYNWKVAKEAIAPKDGKGAFTIIAEGVKELDCVDGDKLSDIGEGLTDFADGLKALAEVDIEKLKKLQELTNTGFLCGVGENISRWFGGGGTTNAPTSVPSGTPSASSTPTPVTVPSQLAGTDNVDKVMKYLMTDPELNLTPEQAAGAVGNARQESYSEIRPDAENNGYYGMLQWSPERQQDFQTVMKKPMKGSTIEEQLAFMKYELTQGKYKKSLEKLKKAKTVEESTKIFHDGVEGSEDTNLDKRVAYAKDALSKYGTTPGTTPTPVPNTQQEVAGTPTTLPTKELNWRKGANTGIDENTKQKLMQLQAIHGDKMLITAGADKTGHVKNSQHKYNKAVDIKYRGSPEEKAKFLEDASAVGFTGIGAYSSGSIHLDTRKNKMTWGDAYTANTEAGWAKEVLARHKAGTIKPLDPNAPTMIASNETTDPNKLENDLANTMAMANATGSGTEQKLVDRIRNLWRTNPQALNKPANLNEPTFNGVKLNTASTEFGAIAARPPVVNINNAQAPQPTASTQPTDSKPQYTGDIIDREFIKILVGRTVDNFVFG